MNKFFLCLLTIVFTANMSMADSYYCSGTDDSGNYYVSEYNPYENECKAYLYTGNIKTDPNVDWLQKQANLKNRQQAESQVLKYYQDQYNECMKSRQVAANAYRQGKCKKLEVRRYTVGSQKCEDKYLNGKKVFGGCMDKDSLNFSIK